MANNLTLIKWAGGKGSQLNALLPLIPYSRVYVEPFGGSGVVLLNRQRSEIEVINDLDHALVNLYSVIRDDDLFELMCMKLDWMPYSKAQFGEACKTHQNEELDMVTQATLFYTMMNQSISGNRLTTPGQWSRGRFNNHAEKFLMKQQKMGAINARLKYVQIECRDALDVLQEWDAPDTTFYVDPPYVLETRGKKKYYAVEPGDAYHEQLVDVLLNVRGMVVLSGYEHPVYLRLRDAGWHTDLYSALAISEVVQKDNTGRIQEKAKTHTGRVEIVYRNPQAADFGQRRPLFQM